MENLILCPIPLSQLEESIGRIIEDKIKNHLANNDCLTSIKEYATREQVAKLLHISLPTLNQLTKSGALISYRIGGRILYQTTEVEQALKQIVTTKYKRGNGYGG